MHKRLVPSSARFLILLLALVATSGAATAATPLPADTLAARYVHPAVGEIRVLRSGPSVSFDFGEWASEVASKRNPDGTTSLVTTAPGLAGLEFVAGSRDGKRTLTLRDAQHEYVLVES
jgi:hypothetical protein